MLSRILLCTVLLSFAIACDDSDGSETTEETSGGATGENAGTETMSPEAQPESYSDFTDRGILFFAELTCRTYITCAGEGRISNPGIDFLLNRHTTIEACTAEFRRLFPDSSQDSSVEAGLIRFDADLAAQCLREIESVNAMTCDELLSVIESTPESCELAAQGTVETGGACSMSDQCADGYCEQSGEQMCEIGVCAPEEEQVSEEGMVMLGEPCEDSQQCAGDLLCSTTDGSCVEPTWHGEGEGCEFGGAKFCNPGLVCQLDLMTFSQTCMQPSGMGETCLFGPQCEIGLTCEGADLENGMPGTCGPLKSAGEPCGLSLDCVEGLTCIVEGERGVCGDSVEECALPMSSME